MHVNSSTSPNFRALKIMKTPESINSLKKLSPKNLKEIKDVGEKIKDTKFFDILLVGCNLSGLISTKASIASNKELNLKSYGDEKTEFYEKKPSHYILNNKYSIQRFNDAEKSHYNVTISKPTHDLKYGIDDLKELADVTLELDNIANNLEKKDAIEKEILIRKQEEAEKLTNELIDSFGI